LARSVVTHCVAVNSSRRMKSRSRNSLLLEFRL
jgi:hypothetical protein